MTVEEFRASDGFAGALLALWWDARWKKAHEVAQDVAGADDVGACLSASQGGGFGERFLLVSTGGESSCDGDSRLEWEGIVGEMLGR